MPDEPVLQDLSAVAGESSTQEIANDDNISDISDVSDVSSDVDSDLSIDSEEPNSSEEETPEEEDLISDKSKPTKIDLQKTEFKNLPKNIKETFKQNPQLKQMFFQNQEYAKAFESPKVAAQVAETLDLYGGIETIQTDLKEMSTVDTMFQAGDPAVVETWQKLSPDGFNKVMPEAIVKFSKVDPEGYKYMAARIQANAFDNAGLPTFVQNLYKMVEPNSEAAKAIEQLYNNFLTPIYDAAKSAPVKKDDPERIKLENDRKQFEDQKTEVFLSDLASTANKVWAERQDKELASYVKGKNLDKDQLAMLNSNIDAKFKKLLAKDTLAQEQMASILRSGDKAKYLKYMNAKLDKYMPEATRQVWRAFTGVNTQQKKIETKTAVDAKKSQTGPILINAIPSPNQIDQTATTKYAKSIGLTYRACIEKNLCVLRNGKLVKFPG